MATDVIVLESLSATTIDASITSSLSWAKEYEGRFFELEVSTYGDCVETTIIPQGENGNIKKLKKT